MSPISTMMIEDYDIRGRKGQELSDDELNSLSTEDVIYTTMAVYGGIFLIMFIIYLIVRPRFPLIYNYRYTKYNTPLARETYGHINWLWKMFDHSDTAIMQSCGLDAIVFLRILRFGTKVSLLGILNSFYLIPLNLHGCRDDDDEYCASIFDRIEQIGIGNVSTGSLRLLGTVFAAYILVIYSIYLIYNEFKWFTKARHTFLAKRRPDNYTVYVSHIPRVYRSDTALLEYFRSIFGNSNVLDAKVALSIPTLSKKIESRENVVGKLEHAMEVLEIKGKRPKHFTSAGSLVDSIDTYNTKLDSLNTAITSIISRIEAAKLEEQRQFEQQRKDLEKNAPSEPEEIFEDALCEIEFCVDPTEETADNVNTEFLLGEQKKKSSKTQIIKRNLDIMKSTMKTTARETMQKGMGTAKRRIDSAKRFGFLSLQQTRNAGKGIMTLLRGMEDGKVLDAGFVTFADLTSRTQAVQMIHHEDPFTFDVTEAPMPIDIYWDNVSIPHQKEQVGFVIATALTVCLCFFWTIPVAFFASLAEISELKKAWPALARWMETHSWLEMLFAQLKPLLLLILVSLLPAILGAFCKHEGHISVGALQSSLFFKHSIFLIIQVFFVQAISGSIWAEINAIARDLFKIVDLLAGSIPGQVKAFIQYVLVQNFLQCGLEYLRIIPIIAAFLRAKLGPGLTEKEKTSPWFGMSPLTVPTELDHGSVLSELMVYFMILFVYSCIAPAMSYIMASSFFLLQLTFRSQIIWTYSNSNDTGGIMWPRTIRLILFCMLVSELTLLGILTLKQGRIAAPLILPLVIGTLLFSVYINQQHYKVAEYLPSTKCRLEDVKNFDQDLSFLKGAYTQPSLQRRVIEVESNDEGNNESLVSYDSMGYMTAEDIESIRIGSDTNLSFEEMIDVI